MHRAIRPSVRQTILCLAILYPLTAVAIGQAPTETNRANYKLAEKYSSDFLRQFAYSTSIRPTWIGKSDRFWYSYRTSEGTRYWIVDPKAKTKLPLFDHSALAASLSDELHKAQNADRLELSGLSIDDDGSKLKFSTGNRTFEYVLATATLTNKGPASRSSRGRSSSPSSTSREDYMRRMEEYRREKQKRDDEEQKRDDEEQKIDDKEQKNDGGEKKSDDKSSSRSTSSRGRSSDYRSFAPDRKAFTYVQGHNLFYVPVREVPAKKPTGSPQAKRAVISKVDEVAAKEASARSDGKNAGDKAADAKKAKTTGTKTAEDKKAKTTGAKTVEDKKAKTTGTKAVEDKKAKSEASAETKAPTGDKPTSRSPRPSTRYIEGAHIQLTSNGAEGYGFSSSRSSRYSRSRSTSQRSGSEGGNSTPSDRRTSARVSWSKDSSAFYVSRSDSRDLKDLFLVNSIAEPRPTLRSYKYTMPGEEGIRRSELHYFTKESKKLTRVTPKWKDESYSSTSWFEDSSVMRFIRRDRVRRNAELCALDTRTGKVEVLISEAIEDANLSLQSARHLKKRKEFIWWSERSGWGHYYLYDGDGKLKNPITRGLFRASSIIAVDEEKGIMWFRGNGREKGENIYYEHLYRVYLDGTGLTLLDPGNATHRSTTSPTRAFLVDNSSRIDMTPKSVLRDNTGKKIMDLEEADLSKLREIGWKIPETFVVKAADGTTNLYGNMWKPFDFDPSKKYPIIASVYPGPQMEGVSHSFSSSSSQQQLAQLGFIVVQVGHRGGTPKRSKSYHAHSYGNLRDYGLADKKTALEQLAARHAYIDIDRVGIYGHSGGGFMSAAAVLKEPYNDFFRVAVASSGNHDNNIYNSSWGERYHGMKEVAVEEKSTQGDESKRSSSQSDQTQGKEKSSKTNSQAEKSKKVDGEKDKSTTAKKTKETKFEITVPTNAELAENLKGHLLLVHGELDTNVHPANTMRLADALLKANKRFDMLILPGTGHGYGKYRNYFTHRMWEHFTEHLLGDTQPGADILEKSRFKNR